MTNGLGPARNFWFVYFGPSRSACRTIKLGKIPNANNARTINRNSNTKVTSWSQSVCHITFLLFTKFWKITRIEAWICVLLIDHAMAMLLSPSASCCPSPLSRRAAIPAAANLFLATPYIAPCIRFAIPLTRTRESRLMFVVMSL
jgi:hypothetical protein